MCKMLMMIPDLFKMLCLFPGPNVQSVASAVEQIYPLLFECQKKLA